MASNGCGTGWIVGSNGRCKKREREGVVRVALMLYYVGVSFTCIFREIALLLLFTFCGVNAFEGP